MTPETVTAVQNGLALEHEAIWVYGYLGGRVPAIEDAARDAFEIHRLIRDRLIAMLDADGATRPAPLMGYDVPTVKDAKQASAIARDIEAKGVATWLSAVGTSEGKERRFAIEMMRRAALAELSWDGELAAFPGLP